MDSRELIARSQIQAAANRYAFLVRTINRKITEKISKS
jgi:hypothetical protein